MPWQCARCGTIPSPNDRFWGACGNPAQHPRPQLAISRHSRGDSSVGAYRGFGLALAGNNGWRRLVMRSSPS